MSSIAGLLPGVECVRLGLCGPEDFSQVGDEIKKAQPGPQVIVKPAEGWIFKFDMAWNCYRAVKTLATKRTFTLVYEAEDEQAVAVFEKLKDNPHVVSVTETTSPEVKA